MCWQGGCYLTGMNEPTSKQVCEKQNHSTVTHSPEGFDKIVECPTCCKAWLVRGFTGEVVRLFGSTYERRLVDQQIRKESIALYGEAFVSSMK